MQTSLEKHGSRATSALLQQSCCCQAQSQSLCSMLACYVQCSPASDLLAPRRGCLPLPPLKFTRRNFLWVWVSVGGTRDSTVSSPGIPLGMGTGSCGSLLGMAATWHALQCYKMVLPEERRAVSTDQFPFCLLMSTL